MAPMTFDHCAIEECINQKLFDSKNVAVNCFQSVFLYLLVFFVDYFLIDLNYNQLNRLDSYINIYKGKMQTHLLELAKSIILTQTLTPQKPFSNEEATAEFRQIICDIHNVQSCLQTLSISDQYIFVYSIAMIKLIQQEIFLYFQDTSFNRNILRRERCQISGKIMMAIAEQLVKKEREVYISNAMIDLIGIILKKNCQTIGINYLQQIVSFFSPQCDLNEPIKTGDYWPIGKLGPRIKKYSNHYKIIVKILNSMMGYITSNNSYKNLYRYHRDINFFKSQYLSYILRFTVQHLIPISVNRQHKSLVASLLQLLYKVFTYPFEVSRQIIDKNDGNQIEIFQQKSHFIDFPSYFLPFISDKVFITVLVMIYEGLVLGHYRQKNFTPQKDNFDQEYQADSITSQEVQFYFNQSRQQISDLLKIIRNVIRPVNSLFRRFEELNTVTIFAYRITEAILDQLKVYEQWFLLDVLDIISGFFEKKYFFDESYDRMHQIQNFNKVWQFQLISPKELIAKLIKCFQKIVKSTRIVISWGKNNPLSRIFDIFANQQFFYLFQQQQRKIFQKWSQKLLQCAYQRFTDEASQILKDSYHDHFEQVQDFIAFYSPIKKLFKKNLQPNLKYLWNLDINSVSPEAKIMWLYLCSQVLFELQASPQKSVKLIMKYYESALSMSSIASLRYIRILLQQLLVRFYEGVSRTELWMDIRLLYGNSVTFQGFLMKNIELCIFNFNSQDTQLVQASLQLFKYIYSHLKNDNSYVFQEYSQLTKNVLKNQEYLLTKVTQFPIRKMVYNLYCLVFIDGDHISKTLQIYFKIKDEVDPMIRRQNCMKYLSQLTGLIESINEQECFQALIELCIDDLQYLLDNYLDDRSACLEDSSFLEVIYKLFYSLSNTQAKRFDFQNYMNTPLKIYQFMYPYVQKIANSRGQIFDEITFILINMVNLNPLASLMNFETMYIQKKDKECKGLDELIKIYFNNIGRVQDINWMQDLIQQNIDFMIRWWQENIFRKLRPVNNLQDIVQSKFWKDNTEKEKLTGLIYEIALYDSTYWNIKHFGSKKEFVEHFDQYLTKPYHDLFEN